MEMLNSVRVILDVGIGEATWFFVIYKEHNLGKKKSQKILTSLPYKTLYLQICSLRGKHTYCKQKKYEEKVG